MKEEVEERKVGDEKEAKNNEFKKREIRRRAVTNLNLMKGEKKIEKIHLISLPRNEG